MFNLCLILKVPAKKGFHIIVKVAFPCIFFSQKKVSVGFWNIFSDPFIHLGHVHLCGAICTFQGQRHTNWRFKSKEKKWDRLVPQLDPICVFKSWWGFRTTKIKTNRGFPAGTSGKESVCQCRRYKRCQFDPWVKKVPWRRKWLPTPVFLPARIPQTEEPGRLQSMASRGVRHAWATGHTHAQHVIINYYNFVNFCHSAPTQRSHDSSSSLSEPRPRAVSLPFYITSLTVLLHQL